MSPVEEGAPLHFDLALVGFGHVGRRFARLLDECRETLLRDHGLSTRIVGIATARHGAAFDAAGLEVARALALAELDRQLDQLHDPSTGPVPRTGIELIARQAAVQPEAVRVVVETTALDVHHGQPATDHVRAALSSGAHVVTANKGPAAVAYGELRELAERAGRSFLFEGTVMDGIPVFNLVRHTMPAVTVLGFRGIVNTTTNYILTAVQQGRAFDDALAEMQEAGIAEADPWLDVQGWDAAAKAAVLANVLMEGRLTPSDVERTGIGPDIAARIAKARAEGRHLRLVAGGARDGDRVTARVGPVALAPDDLLASVHGLANALVLQTDLLGEVAIVQLRGDLTQTAYALVSDLVEVRRRLAPTR